MQSEQSELRRCSTGAQEPFGEAGPMRDGSNNVLILRSWGRRRHKGRFKIADDVRDGHNRLVV